jgi:hypothetical protein
MTPKLSYNIRLEKEDYEWISRNPNRQRSEQLRRDLQILRMLERFKDDPKTGTLTLATAWKLAAGE